MCCIKINALRSFHQLSFFSPPATAARHSGCVIYLITFAHNQNKWWLRLIDAHVFLFASRIIHVRIFHANSYWKMLQPLWSLSSFHLFICIFWRSTEKSIERAIWILHALRSALRSFVASSFRRFQSLRRTDTINNSNNNEQKLSQRNFFNIISFNCFSRCGATFQLSLRCLRKIMISKLWINTEKYGMARHLFDGKWHIIGISLTVPFIYKWWIHRGAERNTPHNIHQSTTI